MALARAIYEDKNVKQTIFFFKKFYSACERAKYVDIEESRDERSLGTRVKISAHKLAIENGRYTNNTRLNESVRPVTLMK